MKTAAILKLRNQLAELGWRSDFYIQRGEATAKAVTRVLALSDEKLGELLAYLEPERTCNYIVSETCPNCEERALSQRQDPEGWRDLEMGSTKCWRHDQ